ASAEPGFRLEPAPAGRRGRIAARGHSMSHSWRQCRRPPAVRRGSVTATQPERRRYDNTRRREQAERTRERIVAAGADLVHESSIRDWRGVTIAAVAERAGVNTRTVYRHFANERVLRDAVFRRTEQEAGVDISTLTLDGVADSAERVFR